MQQQLVIVLGFMLLLVGLWGIVSRKNLVHIIIGFSIMDTGVHVIIVALGYRPGATAPIFDKFATSAAQMVDPIPQALVLTAIVIGLGVTALMLAYAVRWYERKKSLDVTSVKELKW